MMSQLSASNQDEKLSGLQLYTENIFWVEKCPNKTQVHVLVEIGIAKNYSYSIEIGLFVFQIFTKEITDGQIIQIE